MSPYSCVPQRRMKRGQVKFRLFDVTNTGSNQLTENPTRPLFISLLSPFWPPHFGACPHFDGYPHFGVPILAPSIDQSSATGAAPNCIRLVPATGRSFNPCWASCSTVGVYLSLL